MKVLQGRIGYPDRIDVDAGICIYGLIAVEVKANKDRDPAMSVGGGKKQEVPNSLAVWADCECNLRAPGNV